MPKVTKGPHCRHTVKLHRCSLSSLHVFRVSAHLPHSAADVLSSRNLMAVKLPGVRLAASCISAAGETGSSCLLPSAFGFLQRFSLHVSLYFSPRGFQPSRDTKLLHSATSTSLSLTAVTVTQSRHYLTYISYTLPPDRGSRREHGASHGSHPSVT